MGDKVLEALFAYPHLNTNLALLSLYPLVAKH